jgi:hypothetical protein
MKYFDYLSDLSGILDAYRTLNEDIDDYHGNHKAPTKENGSPMHDLSNTYPDDIYSSDAARLYGHYGQNHPTDRATAAIIGAYRGRPDKPIRIYRAVPDDLTDSEKIDKYEKHKKYILKHGRLPPSIGNWPSHSEYYDHISNEIDKLKSNPESAPKVIGINRGDWVTINRKYAMEHGDSQFDGEFKILSKLVKAKDIYTNGDSIHEWGYDPA